MGVGTNYNQIVQLCTEYRQGPLSEFSKLACLYAEQEDLVCIAELIHQSLAILQVTVALIEIKLLDPSNQASTSREQIVNSFEYPMLALQEAYLICMRLVSVILDKMEQKEREDNAYAIKL